MRLRFILPSLALMLLAPVAANAHCDTLFGPVIADARAALQAGDVTPALKWVKAADEPEVREVFRKTMAVRSQGDAAREIADRYFFETLVRVHRAGEGAPFTGLKSEPPEPVLVQADKALASGSGDELVREFTAHVSAELRQRLQAATEARRHAGDSVAAGREYVARYVELMHYLERLHGNGAAPHEQVAHEH